MVNYISSTIENKILKIRLERSHKKNALTEKMYLELSNLITGASKNEKTNVVLASELNTYDIMNANKMLFVESSIKVVEETF